MIEPNNLPSELITFLNERKLKDIFITNTLKCDPSSNTYPSELYYWISCAFDWTSSEHGYDYWSMVNKDWHDQCS